MSSFEWAAITRSKVGDSRSFPAATSIGYWRYGGDDGQNYSLPGMDSSATGDGSDGGDAVDGPADTTPNDSASRPLADPAATQWLAAPAVSVSSFSATLSTTVALAAATPLSDAITQNTPGGSQGFPVGVPTDYSWYTGKDGDIDSTPPANFTAVTGWGQIYPEAGAPAYSNPDATIQVAHAQTWVHLTTGGWTLVQDQPTDQLAGAHYIADYSGDANIAWHETLLSDGSVTVDAPPIGYNDHFWPESRGTYGAGTVDGVYVQMDMRTSDANLLLVANVGADWWLSDTAEYVSGFDNNPGAGMSNWVELSTQWETLYFYSLSTAEFQADLPPPLSAFASDTTPSVVSVVTDPASGDLRAGMVTVTVKFSEAVTVSGGTPFLTLNDGGVANYAGGSQSKTLTFDYLIAPGENTSDLTITSLVLNGATIADATGNDAILSGAVANPAGTLQIDTLAPTVTAVKTSPATGKVTTNHTVKISLAMSEKVTASGAPTLLLNDGGTATYASGSGSSTLTFNYAVKSRETTTDLQVSGILLSSPTAIADLAGNGANLAGAGADTRLGINANPGSPAGPSSGNYTISGTSELELFGASRATVAFASGAAGELKLDKASQFTGQVAGFASRDLLDLGDIAWNPSTSLNYTPNGNNTGGTLVVSDGFHAATIALVGQYAATSFATSADGFGGTLISQPTLA